MSVSQLCVINCFADYHWPSVRDFLARRVIGSLEHVGDVTYSRQVAEGTLVAEYVPSENKFLVKLLEETDMTESHGLLHYRTNMIRVLGCLTPWNEVRDALVLAGVPRQRIHHGLSIVGVWSPFEALLRAICGQQVSVMAAVTQVNRVVALALQTQAALRLAAKPTTVAVDDEPNSICRGIPALDIFVRTDFSSLKMPERRKQTLIDSIMWWQQNMPETDSALDSLLTVKGIGPWTVNYVRLRGFAETDVMLDNDLIVRQQLDKHALNTSAAKPWRSYLCLLLWEWSTLEKQQKKEG